VWLFVDADHAVTQGKETGEWLDVYARRIRAFTEEKLRD
jgi:hypothetical protein